MHEWFPSFTQETAQGKNATYYLFIFFATFSAEMQQRRWREPMTHYLANFFFIYVLASLLL